MDNGHSSLDLRESKRKNMAKICLKPIQFLDAGYYLCQNKDGTLVIFKDEKKKLESVIMGTSTLAVFKPEQVTNRQFRYMR